MSEAILVLNAGSSSLKFSLFLLQEEALNVWLTGQLEGLYTAPRFKVKDALGALIGEKQWLDGESLGHEGALAYLAEFLREQLGEHQLVAVGHRVVHGGMTYTAPVALNAAIVQDLSRLTALAPLHQPHNLKPISILLAQRADLLQVACFDTAFHCTQAAVEQIFALPQQITELGVRRYGFHGLSYEYITTVLPQYAAQARRVVVLHLGNGASMCAIQDGQSVASSMGFTAVDGLPMGTRCGNLDPGVVLYLIDELKMDVRAIEKLLYQQSGLLGVSGLSSDMRTLLDSDEPQAKFAVDLFVYRIARELGALAATMGGIDALVFTAGIGEHAPLIRQRVCQAAAWLGLDLDETANQAGAACISQADSAVSAWLIPTHEEWMIAQHTRQILQRTRVNAESALIH
ncbi:acetate/propionate family kinase [Deefgea piscis]|uniref:acetate/propionate family kinase n=1 Tax=Deefgea piscis TaxID=2739061 RepID=UPI001C7F05F1|nr:acetate/propionate family kinase [Deefgea piscis]QZA80800.1 acetate/propionate family kinase [Deefgea piscis]